MFLQIEKDIIGKQYTSLNDNTKIFSYGLEEDKTKQINLSFMDNKYKFTFPIQDILYSTTFKNEEKLVEYVNYILRGMV
jgi:hypothetical protein